MVERTRRLIAICVVLLFVAVGALAHDNSRQVIEPTEDYPEVIESVSTELAVDVLDDLIIKGRAPRTDYAREQFGAGWSEINGCDTRQVMLARDLKSVIKADDTCTVLSGVLNDPYTGTTIMFTRGQATSSDVQIDHVVALSDAWQKGAQQMDEAMRAQFSNDPLNLLAVDGKTNQQKGDSDAASWLPPDTMYRCRYIARQIAVKRNYNLWVTQSEYDAMRRVLSACPNEALPVQRAD